MKRLILLLALLVLVVPSLALATVEDDFDRPDNATLGTATNGNTWSETESNGAASIHNQEFLFQRTGTGTNKFFLDFSSVNPERYDIDYNFTFAPSTTSEYVRLGGYNSTSVAINLAYATDGANTGIFIYSGSPIYTGYTPTLNTWETLSVRNIDYAANTCEIYVDDVSIYSGGCFQTDTGVTRFGQISRGSSGDNFRLDNLCTGPTGCRDNLTITASDSYTGSSLSSFNASVEWNGTTENYTTTTGTITTNIPPDSGLANVTVTASNYFSNSTTGHNTSAELDQVMTPYTAVYADTYDGNTISNYTVTYDGSDYVTTSGVAYIPLFNETATVIVDDAVYGGEDYQNKSASLTASPYLQNYTFTLFKTNTINVTFRDEETGDVIDDRNITAFFTGSSQSYNYTTSNGTLFEELLSPDDYTITYSADGYEQREYDFTLSNRSYNLLTLYLLNASVDSIITTTVVNTVAQTQDGVVVNAFKKNLSGTNYYRVESCLTNDVGECILHLELNDVTYRFTVTDDGVLQTFDSTGTTVSNDQKIFSTDLKLIIDTGTDTIQDSLDEGLIGGSVTYDNTTETFTYTWSDPTGLDISSCLEVTRTSGANTFAVNTTCSSGASGTITQSINESDGDSFTGIGYVIVDGSERVLDRLTVVTSDFAGAVGLYGIFLFGFIIAGIAAFTGLWNPVVGPALLVVTTFLAGYLGFITIGMSTIGVVSSLLVLVIYLVRT